MAIFSITEYSLFLIQVTLLQQIWWCVLNMIHVVETKDIFSFESN